MLEWIEMIARFGAIFIALGTVIAAVIGAASYARFFKQSVRTFIFMKYTERYEQVMSCFPEDALCCRLDLEGEIPPPSGRISLAALKYLNLCSEEYYLFRRGNLDKRVWKIWEGELKRTLCSPLFRREWPRLKKEFESYPEFSAYVEKTQREEIRSVLEKEHQKAPILPVPVSSPEPTLPSAALD